MKNQWGRLFAYFVGTAIVTTLVLLVPSIGDGQWLPESMASETGNVDDLFWGLTILSIVILSIVMAVVIYSVTHFRAGRGDLSDGAPIHGNHRLEVIWTLIPTIIVVVVGVLSFVLLEQNEEPAFAEPGHKQTVVQVRAFSFGWGFRYGEREITEAWFKNRSGGEKTPRRDYTYDNLMEAEHEAEEGKHKLKPQPYEYTWEELAAPGSDEPLAESADLVLPRSTHPVMFEIMSCSKREDADTRCGRRYGKPPEKVAEHDQNDVLHAFWVPEARLKIDAIPGLTSWIQWTPDQVTTPDHVYQVVCAELCGSGHNGMRTGVCVVDRPTYEWWFDNADATCQTLRFFNCKGVGRLDDEAREELRSRVDDLLADDPDAGCADLEGTE